MIPTKTNKNNLYKILAKLLFFFIPLIFLFFFLFGYLLPEKYRTTENSISEKWKLFFEGGTNAKIVILGSSRALRGYNAPMISQNLSKTCYNFAELGVSLSNYPRFLHDYLLKNKPPEILIVNLDIFAFNFRDRISAPYRMLPFIHKNSRIYNEIYQFRHIKYFKPYGYFLYRHQILDEIKNTKKDSLNNLGFEPLNWEWLNPPALVKNVKPIKNYGIDSLKTSKYFNEIIFLIKKYKIKQTYFIFSPVFYSELHANKNWKEIVKFTQDECKNSNIQIIDMLEDTISQNTKYYYDPIHFNKKGADIFTRKLIEKLK